MKLDAQGNLYSTTSWGGSSNSGNIFKLSPPATGTAWTETVLHNFKGPDGSAPQAETALTFDAAGNMFGTAAEGGKYDKGTVFLLKP